MQSVLLLNKEKHQGKGKLERESWNGKRAKKERKKEKERKKVRKKVRKKEERK